MNIPSRTHATVHRSDEDCSTYAQPLVAPVPLESDRIRHASLNSSPTRTRSRSLRSFGPESLPPFELTPVQGERGLLQTHSEGQRGIALGRYSLGWSRYGSPPNPLSPRYHLKTVCFQVIPLPLACQVSRSAYCDSAKPRRDSPLAWSTTIQTDARSAVTTKNGARPHIACSA